MTKIKVENPVWFDRKNFPCGFGIPFKEGVLKDAGKIVLYDGARKIDLRAKALAKWNDGTIKWAYVDFLSDIKKQEIKEYEVRLNATVGKTMNENPPRVLRTRISPFVKGGMKGGFIGEIKISKGKSQITVDNGIIQVVFDRDCLVKTVNMNKKKIVDEVRFEAEDEKGAKYVAGKCAKMEVEENNGLKTVIRLEGSHYDDKANKFLDFVIRVFIYARNPVIKIEYKFINREEPELGVKAKSIKAIFNFNMEKKASRTVRQMHRGWNWMPRFVKTDERVEIEVNSRRAYVRNFEILGENLDEYPSALKSGLDNVFGWIDVSDGKRGVTSVMPELLEQYPKKIIAQDDELIYEIWSETEGLLQINQGMAKRHEIALIMYDGKKGNDEKNDSIVQWDFPLFVTLDPDYCEKCGVQGLDRVLKYQPEKYPKTELIFRGLFIKNWIKGMLNYGDDTSEGYSASYSATGIKPEGAVWINNETDFIWVAVNQYLRTGQYHPYLGAKIASLHQIDVDFIHYSPDKFRLHGTPAHSVYHTTASAYPSHQWTEGLLAYYFISGDRDYLDTAKKIGDNLLIWIKEKKEFILDSTAREGGWMLIALTSLYDATGEKRYLEGARTIAYDYIQRKKKYGGMQFVIGEPNYYFGEKPFMTSVAMMGLQRYYLVTGDEKIRELFIQIAEWMLKNSLLPEGLPYYEQSIQSRTPGSSFFPTVIAFAYVLTKDSKYLELGKKAAALYLERNAGGTSDTKGIGSIYRSYLEILRCLDEADMLKKYDLMD